MNDAAGIYARLLAKVDECSRAVQLQQAALPRLWECIGLAQQLRIACDRPSSTYTRVERMNALNLAISRALLVANAYLGNEAQLHDLAQYLGRMAGPLAGLKDDE